MTTFSCCFWWFVFGALFGWLANWLLGRIFGKGEATTVVTNAAPPSIAPSPAAGGVDVAAARAAGFMVSGSDNLEVIEGVGPKIAHLLRSNGVKSFAHLAGMSPESIHSILHSGGTHFNMADPTTWPDQAKLAAANRWQELRELQDRIFHGHKKI